MRKPTLNPLIYVLVAIVGSGRATAAKEEGYLTTPDGVELYYVTEGVGSTTVILPGALFAFEALDFLAEDHRLIAYDMRNRGRSQFVQDGSRITIEADVSDLESVRQHFGVDHFVPIGYSYLGLMVVLYALEHPERVDRLVQLGPVPMKFGTSYPESLTARFEHPADLVAGLREKRERDFHLTHPELYCREEWELTRRMLVGSAERVELVATPEAVCSMPNEWPTNLARHLQHHFVGSVQTLDVPFEAIRRLDRPVLILHGTADSNAPYGAGREWALTLPDARLLTLEGGAHHAFAEFPEVVRPALRCFLQGFWPEAAEEVSALLPDAR